MKIRNEAIQDLKTISWIDENVRPAAAGMENSLLIRCRLNGTATGGADTYHFASLCLRTVDELRLIFLYDIKFRVHMMCCHILHLHRAESTKSHMKRYMGDANSFFFDLLQ